MIEEIDKFLIYMSLCEIPNKKQEEMLLFLEDFSLEKLFDDKRIENLLSTEEYHRLVKNFDMRAIDSAIENMLNSGIKILTVYSDDYPYQLINNPDRPLILYAKGDLSLLDEKCFAIIGTRLPSNYGKIITEKFAGELAQNGLVIVSGLCYGTDEIAHRKALEVGGKTIAVVGSGFNKIYPATNTSLAEEIAEKGLLLSEYPPSFQAKKYTFPLRNRIVAGLSMGILITEASFKSGTIHTKEYAVNYSKDVFAVPGNVNSPKSELPNFLIKSGQAMCVLTPEDILSQYNVDKKMKAQRTIALNFEEQQILDALADGEQDFEFLAEKTKISVNILKSYLTTLEIRGLIKKLPAETYALLN